MQDAATKMTLQTHETISRHETAFMYPSPDTNNMLEGYIRIVPITTRKIRGQQNDVEKRRYVGIGRRKMSRAHALPVNKQNSLTQGS